MPPPDAGRAARSPWMDEVRGRLAARGSGPSRTPPLGMRRAAVLIPLFVRDGALWVLFTRRTETVEHHRGQISFPGGSEEDGRRVAPRRRRCARREEEIGVAAADVRYLGALSPLTTVTDFYVEPFVGAIPTPIRSAWPRREIAELIEVPVAALLDPRILERKILPGREEPTLFYHYGAHVIWGATARMLKELLDALRRSGFWILDFRFRSPDRLESNLKSKIEVFSPASTRIGSRFCGGGSGHVEYGVKTQGGL